MRSAVLFIVVVALLAVVTAKVGPLSEKAFGERFLKRMLEQPGMQKTESGVGYQRVQIGPGTVKPTSDSDNITLHVIGRTPHKDLPPFLHTYRGMQKGMTKWRVDNFPAGVREILKMMVPGDIYWVVAPYDLSFGEDGIKGRIPEYSSTSWTLELLAVNGDDGGYVLKSDKVPKARFREYAIEEENRKVKEAREKGVEYTPKAFPPEEDEDDKWYAAFEEKQEAMKKRVPPKKGESEL